MGYTYRVAVLCFVLALAVSCTDALGEDEAIIVIADNGPGSSNNAAMPEGTANTASNSSTSPTTNGEPATNNSTAPNNTSPPPDNNSSPPPDNNSTASNNSMPTVPSSSVTCNDLTCTRQYCDDSCAQDQLCGYDSTECYRSCSALASAYKPNLSTPDCPTVAARAFDCLANATCEQLVLAYSDNPGGAVCQAYVDAYYSDCWFGDYEGYGRQIDVDFLGALIAPRRGDGDPWDGTANVSAAQWSQFLQLFGAVSPYKAFAAYSSEIGAFINFVEDSALDALDKPDPKGYVEWDYGVGWMDRLEFSKQQDTYLPAFNLGTYSMVGGDGTRFRVSLTDVDVVNDDAINTVTIDHNVIWEAANVGGDVWIVVGDSVNPQLVAIKVNAIIR